MTCLEEYDERTHPHNKGRALCMRGQPSWAPRGFGGLAWSAGAVDCPACLRAHVTRLESDLDCAVDMLREKKLRPGIGAVVADLEHYDPDALLRPVRRLLACIAMAAMAKQAATSLSVSMLAAQSRVLADWVGATSPALDPFWGVKKE